MLVRKEVWITTELPPPVYIVGEKCSDSYTDKKIENLMLEMSPSA